MSEPEQLTMRRPVSDKRPTRYDPWVLSKVAADLVEDLREEIDDLGDEPETSLREELLDILTRSFDFDGLSLLRALESRYHWTGDAAIVEVLNRASGFAYKHHEEAEKIWADSSGKTLTLNIGERVRFKHRDPKTLAPMTVEGEVCKLDGDRLRYHVFCASLGHIRESEIFTPDGRLRESGTLSLILNAEDVEAIDV